MPEKIELPLSYIPLDAVKRIGIVALTTDHTTEVEFSRFVAPTGVEIFTGRVEFANPTTPENLRAMLPHIQTTTASILPGTPLDMVYYACTSGSVHIGNDNIFAAVGAAKPDAWVITPASAAVAALRALGLRKLALLTPYTRQTSASLSPYFEKEADVAVVRHCCLGLEDDRMMARLDADTLISAALEADHQDADGLFISCTALRAVEVAGIIEQKIGKPVITSNQAAIWFCLGYLGIEALDLPDNQLFRTQRKKRK